MVNSSMTCRLLSPILVLTLAAGCTDRGENVPVDSQVEPSVAEAQESDDTIGEIEDDGETVADVRAPKARTVEFHRDPRRVPENLPPEQKAQIDKMLSKMGEVELLLDDRPATSDPLLPGRYFLSISILLSNGSPMKNQRPCLVEVDGPNVRILLENSKADPILATIEDGEILSEPREGPGTYGFEGKMVGPGKARGVIIPGPIPHPSVDIFEGRWGLDALPLKKDSEAKDSETEDSETEDSEESPSEG